MNGEEWRHLTQKNNQGSDFHADIKEIAAKKLHSLNLISGDDWIPLQEQRWSSHGECGEVEETQADLTSSPAKEF